MEFKYKSYKNELLAIRGHEFGFVFLENCQKGEKTVKCEISKENLDKISKTQNIFELKYFHEILGSKDFFYATKIKINYDNIIKENIFLKIEKPVYSRIKTYDCLAFPTNITNLPQIKTKFFNFKTSDGGLDCFFINHNLKNSFYLAFIIDYNENFTIKSYDGFNQSDIHYKYNFIMDSGIIDVTVSFNNDQSFLVLTGVYPATLDFSKTDSINISILTDNTKGIKNLGLNTGKTDLECKGETDYKTCIVPKSHFDVVNAKCAGMSPVRTFHFRRPSGVKQ